LSLNTRPWTPKRGAEEDTNIKAAAAARRCMEGRPVSLTIDGATYYTTREAAEALGIEWATVRDAIRRGVLEKRQITPRLNMVPEGAIEAYRREHLGRGSQARRLDPTKPVAKNTLYARAYRERKRAEAAISPTVDASIAGPADEKNGAS